MENRKTSLHIKGLEREKILPLRNEHFTGISFIGPRIYAAMPKK
jgi:hypothetical protein